ncbi:hypothetical protein ES703_118583 [subsurface metagenome]
MLLRLWGGKRDKIHLIYSKARGVVGWGGDELCVAQQAEPVKYSVRTFNNQNRLSFSWAFFISSFINSLLTSRTFGF